jgi:hypothetical protein
MKIPPIIYHYTNIIGLVGIIKDRALWASDCRFLNDGTELSYANDIFINELKKRNINPFEYPPQDGGRIIPSLALTSLSMFIVCFCTDGDLLSQWRGYGSDQGYSLGFSVNKLRKLDIDSVVPVSYGLINPAIYFKNELDDASRFTAHPGIQAYETSRFFLPRIASIKHPGFREEKEWRILKQYHAYEFSEENNPKHINFRPSKMGPIPYLPIPFMESCLREIVIGPGPNTEMRVKSIGLMLRHYDFLKARIRITKIPFRL